MIASGDVTSVAAAAGILDQTGAAAIMVARGASVNPWLVDDLLAGARRRTPPSAEVVDELTRLLGLAADEMGPSRAPRWVRKFLTWFLRPAGVPVARIEELRRIDRVDELLAALAGLAAPSAAAGGRRARVGGRSLVPPRSSSFVLTPCFRFPYNASPGFGTRKGRSQVPQKDVVLTPDGLKRLQEEIDYLSTTKREEVADRIREAREFGDISENSEYDDAKNEQAMLEHRISTLQEKLRRARVIKITDLSTDKVALGSKVTLRDLDYDEVLTYTIVGSAEANPALALLSNESPMGQAILGHKVGEMVTVPAPVGPDPLRDRQHRGRVGDARRAPGDRRRRRRGCGRGRLRAPVTPTTLSGLSERLVREQAAKVERLREAGVDPYARSYQPRTPAGEIIAGYGHLTAGEETEDRFRITGRVMSRREHGKAVFLTMRDGWDDLQVYGRRRRPGRGVLRRPSPTSTWATSSAARAGCSARAAASSRWRSSRGRC